MQTNLLWSSHAKTLSSRDCQQRRNLLIKKNKYSFTKKFLVLMQLKIRNCLTLPIPYTKHCCWIGKVKANRDCIKLITAILSSPLPWKLVQEQQGVSGRNLTPQARWEMRERVKMKVSSGIQLSLKCFKVSDTQETQKPQLLRVGKSHMGRKHFYVILFSYPAPLLLIYWEFEQIGFFWYYSTNQYQNI